MAIGIRTTAWTAVVWLGLISPLTAAPLLDRGSAGHELRFPLAVAATRDGRHVYAVDSLDEAVSIFAHDDDGPALTLLDTEPVLLGSSDVNSIAIAPNDRHVFVSSFTGAVLSYERNPTTGALDLRDVAVEGSADVTGLVQPLGMAVSPQGEFLYVAAQSALVVFTISQDGGLQHFETLENGTGGIVGLQEAWAVATDRSGTRVYVSAAGPPGRIVYFRRNPGSAGLSFVGSSYYASLGAAQPVDAFDVAVSRDGRFLFHGIDVDPGDAGERVGVFSLDEATGVPSLIDDESTNGVLPTGFAERRDGLGIFFADPESVIAKPYDPFSDTYGIGESFPFGAPGNPTRGTPKLAIVRDTLYVADRENDRVQIYAIAPLVGGQRIDDSPARGLDGAASVAVSPDGRHVYATGAVDDAVNAFSRPNAFELDFVETEAGRPELDGADGIAVSPDGKHVYVAGTFDGSIAVFTRDAASGALDFASSVTDGAGSVDGIGGIDEVVVSPDGKHVYAIGGFDDAVAVFGRDATSGGLSFVDRERDGEGSVADLDNPQGLAISPDGRHVYVAAFGSGALVRFARDAVSGGLTYLGSQTGLPNGDSLLQAEGVAVTPDGRAVLLAVAGTGSLVSLARDAVTGATTFADRARAPDEVGLAGANAVATSRDGRYVYAASRDPGSLTVFLLGDDFELTQLQRETTTEATGLDGARGVAAAADAAFVTSGTGDALSVFVPEPGATTLGSAAALASLALAHRKRRRGIRSLSTTTVRHVPPGVRVRARRRAT